MIQSLTSTNQSLINQVRATDLQSLNGLEAATSGDLFSDNRYVSTEDREYAAWVEASSVGLQGIGDEVTDDDLAAFRSGL